MQFAIFFLHSLYVKNRFSNNEKRFPIAAYFLSESTGPNFVCFNAKLSRWNMVLINILSGGVSLIF